MIRLKKKVKLNVWTQTLVYTLYLPFNVIKYMYFSIGLFFNDINHYGRICYSSFLNGFGIPTRLKKYTNSAQKGIPTRLNGIPTRLTLNNENVTLKKSLKNE